MELKMFIKGALVDSSPITIRTLSSPGYIHALRMDLEEKHEEVIDLSNEEPQFFIDHIPSSMNKNRFFQD